ncbi:hypothetical protein ASPWEDRAFT_166336 [Aspergillus wentii DTO 134E9]|uniref:Uncharacterized protein n=1 Tax=Aspergillus wentii DTO 134E9 TaxID=1073089 RepID=A0A1L9RZF8_ASPWE|nr:uncharacterized protein ASPWEDRAFT_166336 [Aspergillus wentii DTO 134E9]KAI9932681.1 hypothetical protein MW887_008930 [Aspergillus wentii]OJJ40254.1 hypothetical protein ASPWEDRAFT_166336 [Aspergillus wentii DTO 134E9]
MFEDFSFSSPSSTRPPRLAFDGDDRLMVDGDSSMISPMSSRCPSPPSSHHHPRLPRTLSRPRSLYFRSPQPPTSVPFPYDQKRLSIATLTKKLHEHTLRNPENINTNINQNIPDDASSPSPTASARFPGYFLTPPDTDHDDEGCDSSSLTSPSLSSLPQSPFLSPTSVPADFASLDSPAPTAADRDQDIRTQRQRMSRLQCSPTDIEAIRRALLSSEEASDPSDPFREDDCHPSSLPPQLSPRRRAVTLNRSRAKGGGVIGASESRMARRKSSSGALPSSHSSSSHRIEKNYYPTSGRDLRKKSEQGLRRKSLVSAALASMVEKNC